VGMFAKSHEHFYVIPDYVTEEDAKKIVAVFGDLKLLTGGSGLLSALGAKYRVECQNGATEKIASGTQGPSIILVGSCSEATLRQIEEFASSGGKTYKIDPLSVLRDEVTIDDIWSFVMKNAGDEILIYSSDNADKVKEIQRWGKEKISALLESLMAELGKRAYASGINRIIVAGGETAGAVMLGLGFDCFIIGESIAPGVPIMVPANRQNVRLVLKSGNFGQIDFFRKALEMTRI
jgi:3-dehydrotetronate 4-kinase